MRNIDAKCFVLFADIEYGAESLKSLICSSQANSNSISDGIMINLREIKE